MASEQKQASDPNSERDFRRSQLTLSQQVELLNRFVGIWREAGPMELWKNIHHQEFERRPVELHFPAGEVVIIPDTVRRDLSYGSVALDPKVSLMELRAAKRSREVITCLRLAVLEKTHEKEDLVPLSSREADYLQGWDNVFEELLGSDGQDKLLHGLPESPTQTKIEYRARKGIKRTTPYYNLSTGTVSLKRFNFLVDIALAAQEAKRRYPLIYQQLLDTQLAMAREKERTTERQYLTNQESYLAGGLDALRELIRTTDTGFRGVEEKITNAWREVNGSEFDQAIAQQITSAVQGIYHHVKPSGEKEEDPDVTERRETMEERAATLKKQILAAAGRRLEEETQLRLEEMAKTLERTERNPTAADPDQWDEENWRIALEMHKVKKGEAELLEELQQVAKHLQEPGDHKLTLAEIIAKKLGTVANMYMTETPLNLRPQSAINELAKRINMVGRVRELITQMEQGKLKNALEEALTFVDFAFSQVQNEEVQWLLKQILLARIFKIPEKHKPDVPRKDPETEYLRSKNPEAAAQLEKQLKELERRELIYVNPKIGINVQPDGEETGIAQETQKMMAELVEAGQIDHLTLDQVISIILEDRMKFWFDSGDKVIDPHNNSYYERSRPGIF